MTLTEKENKFTLEYQAEVFPPAFINTDYHLNIF